MTTSKQDELGEYPYQVREGIWAFPSNKATNGGTAWWLDCEKESVLIDCPPLTSQTIEALGELAGDRGGRILLTSRQGHGKIFEIQEKLGWSVVVQEEEAYLLPDLNGLESFSEQYLSPSGMRMLWTPGLTPGSSVVYAPSPWNVLFCGRLLIPVNFDRLAYFSNQNTFHFSLQQKSIKKMLSWLPSDSKPALASGASLGALTKKKLLSWESWEKE